MKARKLEWTFHAGMGIYYSNDEWDFKIYKASLELHKGTECIDEFDTLEEAKQAAQDHADKMVADMIDPEALQELVAFAFDKGYHHYQTSAKEIIEQFNNGNDESY